MKNVGIICGGYSSEFDISIKSALNIRDNFPDNYQVFLIVLNEAGWFVRLTENQMLDFNESDFSFLLDGDTIKIDLAIVFIHGDPGENGKVQAYLEMRGIKYVNSGPLASHLSFDKWCCNQFLKGFGLNVAKNFYLRENSKIDYKNIADQLGLPLFVKPCDSGSSFGIAKVSELSQLKPAIDDAFREGETIIIEEFLDGTEVTCGIYRSKKGIVALPLTEIVSHNDFFDYQAKYEGRSEEITPARISEDITVNVQTISKKIYELLNLRSVARIDFMIVGSSIYVIEVNTTPGFSNESIVPKMIAAKGMTNKQFWTEIMSCEDEN